jgi:anti-sigma regulatory factor (Ser/Thr protein kinase)
MEFVFKTGDIEPDKVSLYLATHLGEMGFIEGRRISTVALAFNEVLTNAIEHGNLELPVNYFLDNPDTAERESVYDLKNQRLLEPRYADRDIVVRYTFKNDQTDITIIDQGAGFDTGKVMRFLAGNDDLHAEGCGRGLILLKYAVDQVRFNEKGNEVTLCVKSSP